MSLPILSKMENVPGINAGNIINSGGLYVWTQCLKNLSASLSML